MAPIRKHDMQLRPAMTEEIAEIWDERWFGMVVGIETVYYPSDVSGLALVDRHDEIVALVTYHVDGPAGQIVTLDTVQRGRGFGGRLLEVIENKFKSLGLGRSWVMFANDNLRAAGLYLSRGYRLVKIHLDAVDRVREYKPKLPDRGYEGYPIRDLWEFEKMGPIGGLPTP